MVYVILNTRDISGSSGIFGSSSDMVLYLDSKIQGCTKVRCLEIEYPNNDTYGTDVRPILLMGGVKTTIVNNSNASILVRSPVSSGTSGRVILNSTNMSILTHGINGDMSSINLTFQRNDGQGQYQMNGYVTVLLEFI